MKKWYNEEYECEWEIEVVGFFLENKKFFKGNFFDYPNMTEEAVHKIDCTDIK